MKRKTIIQLTAALAAVGLVMIGVDRNTSKVAFAAFEGVEGSSEFIDTAEYNNWRHRFNKKRLYQAQKIFQKKVQSKQRLRRQLKP